MINSAQKLLMARAGAVPPDRSWDIGYASYDWNDAGRFDVSGEETSPQGVFFKPDGTKMYIVGAAGDEVNEYSLSTAWDVSTASYVQNFSVNAQEAQPMGLFFKDDGTKMYVVGQIGDDVNEYSLSTAWDVSTASYSQNFSVSAQDTKPQDVFFKTDGTKMYVVGTDGDDVIEYSLSTAWDVSTASYFQNFSVASQETSPTGIFFKPDGTKMYVCGSGGDDVNEYSLSTAWDVSTSSYVQNFSVAKEDTFPTSLFFKSDGTKMYVVGSSSYVVWAYSLSTAWDVSTASWDEPSENYFSVAAQETGPGEVFFKPDGTKMYITGFNGVDVTQYDLSTAWDISTASYVQEFSVSSRDSTPISLSFKPDGTKMYILGNAGKDVNEYDLSTAWDISTASFSQTEGIGTQELNPTGLFFKPDGTKMYITGFSGVDVNQYDLSTAWDVSSASYVQNFSVASQETSPQGLFFKDDGTKMYVVGVGSDAIYEYDIG